MPTPVANATVPFSDQLLKNPKVVESNRELKEGHTVTFAGRLPGLKFLRTLWVASLAGGPFQYTTRELRDAHFDLKIPPEVFDEVDAELGRTLDHFNVPEREKGEVLGRLQRMEGRGDGWFQARGSQLASLALSRSSLRMTIGR